MLLGKRVLLSIFILSICICVFFYFHTNQSNYITSLDHVDVKKLDVIQQLESPDQKHKITIYLAGGVFMKSDYSYIGQLSSKDKSEKERFILWLPGEPFNIKWINNKEILVNQKHIRIKSEYYDFRSL